MKSRIHPHADLNKKRNAFLLLGFVFSTALVLASFEFKTETKPVVVKHDLPIDLTTVEYTPISVLPEKKVEEKVELPKKVVKKSPTFEKVPDDTKVVDPSDVDKLPEPDVIPETDIVETPVPETVNFAEVMPVFKTGDQALMEYIANHIIYPENAVRAGIAGKVYVSFVVNEFGQVTQVKLMKGIGGGCDEEAMRVIQSLPTWTPGRQGGLPVRVKYTLPVNFILN